MPTRLSLSTQDRPPRVRSRRSSPRKDKAGGGCVALWLRGRIQTTPGSYQRPGVYENRQLLGRGEQLQRNEHESGRGVPEANLKPAGPSECISHPNVVAQDVRRFEPEAKCGEVNSARGAL